MVPCVTWMPAMSGMLRNLPPPLMPHRDAWVSRKRRCSIANQVAFVVLEKFSRGVMYNCMWLQRVPASAHHVLTPPQLEQPCVQQACATLALAMPSPPMAHVKVRQPFLQLCYWFLYRLLLMLANSRNFEDILTKLCTNFANIILCTLIYFHEANMKAVDDYCLVLCIQHVHPTVFLALNLVSATSVPVATLWTLLRHAMVSTEN